MGDHADIDHTGLTGVGGGGLTQAYVGYNVIGGTAVAMTAQRIYAKKVTLATDALLIGIEAYLDAGTASDQLDSFSCGLYSDNAGTPRSLLGYSMPPNASLVMDETAGAGGNTVGRWFGIPFSRWLAAGDYWLAVMVPETNGSLRIYKDGSGTDRYMTTNAAGSNGFFIDWGHFSPTTTTDRFSIRGSILT